MTKDIKISVTLDGKPWRAAAQRDGVETFVLDVSDGAVTCEVRYDYDDAPLCLNAKAAAGDRVEIVLMAHRIELRVNGRVEDEEWPAGSRLFAGCGLSGAPAQLRMESYVEPEESQADVLGVFTGAEGWQPEENVFVGDCMPYVKDGEYHVLYLKDRHHHRSKWGLGAHQWEHISTRDFAKWTIPPMAVPITDPSEASICTGSWIRRGKMEYLFYTVRRGKGVAAPIRRSVSQDGYRFKKDESFSFELSDKYVAWKARDPKVILGEDGQYHLFITTRLSSDGRGCIAHYVSSDLDCWRDAGEPIYVADDEAEPECPDYIHYAGRYYLIFSLHARAQYLISDRPFDGWRAPKEPAIPCGKVPKGAIWGERIVFTGFQAAQGCYGGTMTFKAAVADEDGELAFMPLSDAH